MPIPVHSAKWDPPRLHISWLKWHKTFLYQVALTDFPLPSPSLFLLPPKYWAGKVDDLGSAGNTGSKAVMCFSTRPQLQATEKFLKEMPCWVLPLHQTPQPSAGCWIKLCCSVGGCSELPPPDASSTGTPELESSAWKTSSKSSPHPSSHHQAMPRFSELH